MAFPGSARRWPALCAAVLWATLAPSLAAQPSPGAETIGGRVIAADSTPVPLATIRVTAADGHAQATTTDAGGRYELVLSAGSGPYAVQASAFGYIAFTAAIEVEPGTRRALDFRLNPRPVALEEIRVVAATPTGPERGTPAERAERWDASLVHVHPVDPGDFAQVGSMVPGAVRSGDGLSIAGQSAEQNGTTVDGATYGGSSLPSEGVRSVAVFGTTYDVARGQFSGGQVAASTISGTNLWGGAVTAQLDDPALRYGAPVGLSGERGRVGRLSAGGGGAMVRDRLFVYGALDFSGSRSGTPALDRLDAAALRQLALAPDSASRFAQIAGRLGVLSAESPLDYALSESARGLVRVDWALPRHGSVTARLDWRGFQLSGLGASPLRLSGGTSEVRSEDAGLLLQHAAAWSGVANSLRVYRSAGRTRTGEDEPLPSGVVRVSSLLEDGTSATSFLAFGGSVGVPGEGRALWEVGDDLRITVGSHQVRAGFLLQEERASTEAFTTAGTFTFNSLDDLERGRASSFTRPLQGSSGEAARRYGALYLGDAWRPGGGVAIIYGLRLDGSRYAARSELTPELTSLVGAHAVQVPSDLILTPRIGFTYVPPGSTKWMVEGGVGGFAGVSRLAQLAPRWEQTGTANPVLACVGPAAPVAEWARYVADPAAVPTTCVGGSPAFSSAVPAATVFHRNYRGARTWRASLGARRTLTPRWGVRVDGLLVRGTGLPTAIDLNLRESPEFVLAGEAGRPVFAAPGEIDPATGRIAPGAGRPRPAFGAVDELGAGGRSWTAQLGVGTGGFYRRSILLDLRYTFTHARTLTGGIPAPGALSASTAGDPARLEWIDAPFTPRHHIYATVSGRPARRLRLSAIATLASGLPFTPLVGGDVNGDGRSNDRAFLSTPDETSDVEVAAGIRRLIEDGPAGVRRCLRAGAGRMAAPGACRTPWTPSLDLRAEFVPWGALNARRFVVGIDARNVTAGLDHLLHGSERLRGWGQSAVPDDRLLEVRAFDAARRAFQYDVNPRFGRPISGGSQRSPFRLVIEGRITLGADPRYQPLMQAIELGSGRSRESVRAEVAGRLRNVPATVLQLHTTDTAALALTVAQRAFLRAAADSLAPQFAAAADSLAMAFTANGSAPVVRAARVQEASLSAARVQEAAIGRTRAILTPAQWERLPAWITRPVELADLQRSPPFQVTVP